MVATTVNRQAVGFKDSITDVILAKPYKTLLYQLIKPIVEHRDVMRGLVDSIQEPQSVRGTDILTALVWVWWFTR